VQDLYDRDATVLATHCVEMMYFHFSLLSTHTFNLSVVRTKSNLPTTFFYETLFLFVHILLARHRAQRSVLRQDKSLGCPSARKEKPHAREGSRMGLALGGGVLLPRSPSAESDSDVLSAIRRATERPCLAPNGGDA
jgi:hypothetical protein